MLPGFESWVSHMLTSSRILNTTPQQLTPYLSPSPTPSSLKPSLMSSTGRTTCHLLTISIYLQTSCKSSYICTRKRAQIACNKVLRVSHFQNRHLITVPWQRHHKAEYPMSMSHHSSMRRNRVLPVEGFTGLRTQSDTSHGNLGKSADVVSSAFHSFKCALNMEDKVEFSFTFSRYALNISMGLSLSVTEWMHHFGRSLKVHEQKFPHHQSSQVDLQSVPRAL